MIVLSSATFAWMLQCISPHLTIDPTNFYALTEQYQRWLARNRYACTYHHTTWLDTIKSYIPYIPFLNPGIDPLLPPRRDPPHAHDFDYGWGTGPIVDSYGGMYKLAGAVPRVPGHHKTISSFDSTHEYIHPICEYRRIARGPEPNSALKAFTRKFEPSEGKKKGRFWWYKDDATEGLPEWVILKHGECGGVDVDGCGKGEVNFERHWYEVCEKTEKTLAKLKEAGYEKDFLAKIDDVADFDIGEKQGWEYP
jgi:hypothetical protein